MIRQRTPRERYQGDDTPFIGTVVEALFKHSKASGRPYIGLAINDPRYPGDPMRVALGAHYVLTIWENELGVTSIDTDKLDMLLGRKVKIRPIYVPFPPKEWKDKAKATPSADKCFYCGGPLILDEKGSCIRCGGF